MPSAKTKALTRSPRGSITSSMTRNYDQQPPSSISRTPNTTLLAPKNLVSNSIGQSSQHDAVRADDRRRRAAGDFPEPDWSSDESLKAWLEQRFPQGTAAGSPYLQYLIAGCELNGPYVVDGLGNRVGRLSEVEMRRWGKEQPGITVLATWSRDPLYPDIDDGEDRELLDHPNKSTAGQGQKKKLAVVKGVGSTKRKSPKIQSGKRKQPRQPPKSRQSYPEAPSQGAQYTRKHLRSGVGKRDHAPSSFVHLEQKGRKAVQVAGCFR